MNTSQPHDPTSPDSAFEAELRSRLRELADHAPTAVPALGELPRGRVRPPRVRSRLWFAAATSAVVLTGAGTVALFMARQHRNDVIAPVDTDNGSIDSTAPATSEVVTSVGVTATDGMSSVPDSTVSPSATSSSVTASGTSISPSTGTTSVPPNQ